jgi:hypothetical protein
MSSDFSKVSYSAYNANYSLTSAISLTANTLNGHIESVNPQANQIPVLDANANLNLPYTYAIVTKNYTIRRVDLTNATSDYPLAVGEEAIINFKNATSVPLHIATQDGTVYEMHVISSNTGGTSGGSSSPIYLNPNNTTYSNAFVYAELYRNSDGAGSGYTTYSAFRISWAFPSLHSIIINRTVYKNIKVIYDIYGVDKHYPSLYIVSTDWQDTTTAWTSLGTITFPQNTSGQILVRRLV